MDDSHLILILQVGFFVLAPMPKVFCWWPPASFFYFFHAQKRKNPSASYLFNDGTTWAMSRWWICRMRQRARHQPRRNNCQHWVVVVASSSTNSVWCTKSNHLWNARKQIRTFLELNKAVLAWLGRGKKKLNCSSRSLSRKKRKKKPREGSSDETVLFWCQSFSISFVSAAAIVHEADRTDSAVLGAGLVFFSKTNKNGISCSFPFNTEPNRFLLHEKSRWE